MIVTDTTRLPCKTIIIFSMATIITMSAIIVVFNCSSDSNYLFLLYKRQESVLKQIFMSCTTTSDGGSGGVGRIGRGLDSEEGVKSIMTL